jgi:uncharacterized damage-inducible protein DinB
MTRDGTHPQVGILLELLDQGYDRKAWHGPNLKGSIRRVSASQAGWRPGPDRHSIAEQVLHAAYWKYAVRRRLRGDKRGSFALKGSNWFRTPDRLTEPEWREYTRLLDAEHKELRVTVAELPPNQLRTASAGSRFSNMALIQGIAAHDIYHAGQIQLLKRLQGGGES